MASVSREPSGKYRVQFVGVDGSRQTLRLPTGDRKTAESIARHVDALLGAKLASQPIPRETAAWLSSIGDALRARLARIGLIDQGPEEAVTVVEWVERYIASRTDVKPLTRRHLTEAGRKLVAFFGKRTLASITPGDADEFRRFLSRSLSINTVRRMAGRAKQFFHAAQRKRIIAENPFADMKDCGVKPNRERDYFVTREEAEAVLDACPDAQWRLIFALCRYGGLRCPSEVLALTWDCVNWSKGRLRVPSPKTEHIDGRGERIIPIFPELRPHLEACWELAPEGVPWIITRYRDAEQNPRTTLTKIIRRAGLVPWPKLFQNLRSSRATELAREYPGHVAAEWLGHTTLVAQQHYWRVTDADFERALRPDTSDGKPTQNPTQQMRANSGDVQKDITRTKDADYSLPLLSPFFRGVQSRKMPRDGLEPSTL